MAGSNYSVVFERLFDAVVVTDRHGFINYANPALSDLLGWPPAELLNKPLADLIPERLRRAHQVGFERFFGGGEPRIVGKRPLQIPALHRDGHEVDIELSLSELRDERDEVLVVGVLRDLAERHAFERELKVTSQLRASVEAAAAFAAASSPAELYETVVQRLHDSFDTVSCRIWLVDGEMMWSTAAAGPVDDASYSTVPVNMVTHPYRVAYTARERTNFFTNAPGADEALDVAWIAEHGVTSVAMLPLIAGERLYGVLTYYGGAELFPEVARAMEAFAVMVASALRDAEQIADLRASQKRDELLANASNLLGSSLNYEKTLAAVGDLVVRDIADWCAIYLVDDEDRPRQIKMSHRDPEMVEWVAELQRRFPPVYTREEGIGRVLYTGQSEFVPDITPEMIEMALEKAPPRPDGLVIEPTEMRELLEKLDLRSYMTVPLIARGRSIGVITLVRGAAAPRFTSEDLLLVEDLARRAAYAIDNAQLYGEANEAVRVRDHFMGLASHELRTPITVVLGAAQSLSLLVNRALAEHPEDEKVALPAEKLRSRLRMVDDASRNLAKLADRMLDVTRLQRGVLQISVSDVDLAVLTREAVANAQLRQQHGHSRDDVRIEMAIEPEEVRGDWDGDRLSQVLTNLIDNALKYSKPDGVIEVRLSADDERAHLTVQDDGIGIAPEQQAHIFEPFARGSNSAENNYPGFGMGLALSRSIVELHGGQIGVESAGVDRGSRFWVDLPRHAPAAGEPATDGAAR